ncbi:MAG: hypothetical protein ABWY04_07490 [Arthrobacter sp.]
MASFTLDGTTYEYLRPDPGHDPRTRGRMGTTVPLASGAVDVYARAQRWNPSHILVAWADDGRHSHWAWMPAGNVERLSDSEWDVEEYRRCPDNLRHIRWGNRLPGFLPA